MSKFVLFTEAKKKKILRDFYDIVKDKQAIKNYPIEKFVSALSGTFNNGSDKTKKGMYQQIMDIHKTKVLPIIKEDSFTAWVNQATEQYGLEVRDIMAMEFGQKIKVILFDRNLGEYFGKYNVGDKINPRNEGCTYAEYIHGEGITGMLCMYEMGIVHAPFTWELNHGCGGCFWGPLNEEDDISKLNPRTKVGWRGPCIDAKDAKFLPKTITFYDTWWNEYCPYRYDNYLKVKRIKSAPK
uniref:Uncharacterized protein n=1 Tax=viral metagenome TaxID=1070528 RepID=A0A6C0CAL7_9ZZZZ